MKFLKASYFALPEILPVNAVVVYSAGARAANSER